MGRPRKNKHAKFGSPSTLARSEKCPGWVAYTKDMPAPEPSEYALEGTYFHEVMEKCFSLYLKDKKNKVAKIVEKARKKYPEMPDLIMSTLIRVNHLWTRFEANHIKAKYFTELKVKVDKDIYGTADLVFVGKNKVSNLWNIVVIDYKNGAGTIVTADDNRQILAYIIGASRDVKEDIGVVRGIIAQVKLEDGWTECNYTAAELATWEDNLKAIVDKVKAVFKRGVQESDLHAGAHCKYCPADGQCIAQKRDQLDDLAVTMVELPVEEIVRKLTLDDQVKIFHKKSQIEDFLDAVAKNLTAAFMSGVTHPELKLIRPRGNRKWLEDEKLVASKLIDKGMKEPFTAKLKGIGEVEKEIGKGKLDDITRVNETKLQLVHSSDERPEVKMLEGFVELE